MATTYKILSVLLDYPDNETVKNLPLMTKVLKDEHILADSYITKIKEFIDYVSTLDLIDWQEKYTSLFDYNSAFSLYLFDHVYGNSKDRGTAMVELKEMYQKKGMDITSGELPDYLPLMLEFLSIVDKKDNISILKDAKPVLEKIENKLKDADVYYGKLLESVISLAKN